MARIVLASNYDDEMFTEQFLNIPVDPRKGRLKSICDQLNDLNPQGPIYYKVVEDDYKLYKFEP